MKYVKEYGLFIDSDYNLYSLNSDGKLYALPFTNGGTGDSYFKVAYYMVDENGNRVSGKQRKAYVHRVIATACVPNPGNKPTVDHINRNTHDNRPENMRWSTMQEQLRNRSICDDCVNKYHMHWYEDPKEYRRRRYEREKV